MPFNCDVCGKEYGYSEGYIEECNLGHKHTYCSKKCRDAKDKTR